MTKEELINRVIDAITATEGATISPYNARAVVNTTLDTIKQTLLKGENVALMGFGEFSIVEYSARKYNNPYTKKVEYVEARNHVKFKPSKLLADALKQR